VDYDGDGDLDLLCGETNGQVHVFLNVGTPAAPKLTFVGYLQVGGHDLDIGEYASPAVADWNGDGLWDLLVGGGEGTIGLFINEGTPSTPLFNRYDLVMEGDSPIQTTQSAAPAVADLNGDGLPDLLVGEMWPGIRYYPNRGAAGAPAFAGHSVVRANGRKIDFLGYTKPCVTDWNDDGLPDLLVGHEESVMMLFLAGEPVPAPEFSVTFLGPEFVEPEGGTVSFDVSLDNPHDLPVTFDFYMSLELDDLAGTRIFLGPLMTYEDATLGPRRSFTATVSRYIPASALPGYYDCTLYVGDASEWEFTGLGTFQFSKLW
jgi:hypothetical protein